MVRKTKEVSLVAYLYPILRVNYSQILSRNSVYGLVSFSLTEVGIMEITPNSNESCCPIRNNLIFFMQNTLQQDYRFTHKIQYSSIITLERHVRCKGSKMADTAHTNSF
ncbi:hypothetical protein WN48_05718 [Eufriesea mexicana]|nr:hypothetical protein WN48_05718 [Eufriesea mexicana]